MFPKDKKSLQIKTKGLPNSAKSKNEIFEFRIILQMDCFNLSIPSTPKGRDYASPISVEQETWLREIEKDFESGFKEIWYCLWNIKDEKTLQRFLRIIESNIVEKEYL